jgi:hypothetical protein
MLLGTTAVIRLKSPLAHGGYSKTIDRCARSRRYKGKNRATLYWASDSVTLKRHA